MTLTPERATDLQAEDTDGTVTRRSLLRGAGLGAAAVVVAAVGVGSYRVYDNGVLDSGYGAPYDPWRSWQDDHGPLGMVAAAILAANPHNSQSWSFAVTPTQIDVYADLGRRTGALDPFGREQQIGLGCALENLLLAAQASGYQPTTTLLPTSADPTHVAAVALARASTSALSAPLHGAIGDRHSNRGPYTSQPVEAALLAALEDQVRGLPDLGIRWFTTAPDLAAMGAMLVDAAVAVTNDEQQSRDAFAWFRNDRADIDNHRDGLTLDGQGLSPVVLSLGKILPASDRSAGDAFWVDQTRTVHTATAAAYGVVTVADPADPRARLTGGRLLQRIHLAATTHGLALQHMNQVTERIDRELSLGSPATFAPRMASVLDRTGQQALSTFRVGYPVRAARLSPRRAVSAVTR